ncbi:hypothetical protein F4824DRAFT_278401 [Ustulina deusta]|nr:hypothetical protein F4824DRAFT_278401 [Ustulina deusta]
MATTPHFAATRLVRSHLCRQYPRLSSKPFYNSTTLAAHCRLGISTPARVTPPMLAAHLLRPLMSSATSRTASGEQPSKDEKSQPRGITGEEWDAASGTRKIKMLLAIEPKGRPARWGWVVYRTSYKPELDSAWAALQDRIETEMRDYIAHSDTPDIVDQMDWVFVQDAAALDGITRDALRRRFQAWALAEAPDLAAIDWARGARYEFFLQADEHALASVLQPREKLGTPYVNLVRAWDEPLLADKAFDEDGEPYDPEDWMKMALDATLLRPGHTILREALSQSAYASGPVDIGSSWARGRHL